MKKKAIEIDPIKESKSKSDSKKSEAKSESVYAFNLMGISHAPNTCDDIYIQATDIFDAFKKLDTIYPDATLTVDAVNVSIMNRCTIGIDSKGTRTRFVYRIISKDSEIDVLVAANNLDELESALSLNTIEVSLYAENCYLIK